MQSSPAFSCAATHSRTASSLPTSNSSPSRRQAETASPGAASQAGLGRLPAIVALTPLFMVAGMGTPHSRFAGPDAANIVRAMFARPIFARVLFAAGILLMLMPAAWAQIDPDLVRAAEKEGTVTWYTGLIVNQIARPLAEAFEKKYPAIKVQYSRASNTETALKIINEARARRIQVDVFDVTSGIFPLLEAKGVASYA